MKLTNFYEFHCQLNKSAEKLVKRASYRILQKIEIENSEKILRNFYDF